MGMGLGWWGRKVEWLNGSMVGWFMAGWLDSLWLNGSMVG